MNREKAINWLRENTTREQWNNRDTLFFVGVHEPFTFDWETTPYDCGIGVCVRGYGKNKDAEPIHYQDVFEQPVFIDGAEYILHFNDEPPRHAWYKSSLNEFHENMNSYPASGFGTKFTVGLVSDPSAAPVKPDSPLYDRIVKALGDRKVPIAGESHLVGQVVVDHQKAVLLDKVIEEFNIPTGGDVIKWLHNRTAPKPEIHPDSPFHADNVNDDSISIDFVSESGFYPLKQDLRAIEGVNEWLTTMESVKNRNKPRNKYDREILPGVYVDVYDVLGAFPTESPAIDHAVKKLLAPGQRGVKDRITDLKEAVSSIQREIDRIGEWEGETLGITEDEIIDATLSVFDKPSGGSVPKGKSYVISEKGPTTYKPHDVPKVDTDGTKYKGDDQ